MAIGCLNRTDFVHFEILVYGSSLDIIICLQKPSFNLSVNRINILLFIAINLDLIS